MAGQQRKAATEKAKTDGKDLQRLIHAIESALQIGKNVKVESPKRLIDRDTGRLREHDVVLTFAEGHHELIVAIECRDRSRAIGVPDVEAFWSKCQRTGINSGIMVSSKGFTKTALVKASSCNVGCLALEEAASFDWCMTPGVVVVSHDLVKLRLHIEFDKVPPEGTSFELEDGSPLEQQMTRDWARQLYDVHVHGRGLVGTHEFTFCETDPPIYHSAEGVRTRATRMILLPTYTIERKMVPFEFRSYFDKAKSRTVTNAAVASIQIDGRATSVVLSQEENGGIKFSLVPDPCSSKK